MPSLPYYQTPSLFPSSFRRSAGLLLALGVALASAPVTVIAEGSRDLYPSGYGGAGAGRANLNLSTLASQRYLGIIPSRSFLYVYAEAGEQILLGSRNRTSAGVGVIEVYQPPAGQTASDLGFGIPGDETVPAVADFTCGSGTVGLIPSREAELAGPNSADGTATVADGYTPCAYVAPVSGVYAVLFSGSSGTGVNGSVTNPTTAATSVSAWDVTVRNGADSLTNIDGRLFTYAYAGTTGGNGDGRRLYNTLYYVTNDGYRYAQIQRGMDPNIFAMYSNAQGFLDQDEPLYKSVRSSGHYLTGGILPADSGIVAQRPQYPIFFTNPMSATGFDATRAYLDIPASPPAPQISNINFAYPPTSGSTTYVGMGGLFTFDAVDAISYQIVISRDGVDYDPAHPLNRVLNGSVVNGTNQVSWNGQDNSGNPFPAGAGFEFQASVRNGEVHFPFVDAENNLAGGPTVLKLNGPNAGDATVYFDDRGYVTRNGTAVGTLNGDICGQGFTNQPSPDHSLTGIDSDDADLNGPGTYYRNWDGSVNSGGDCTSDTQFFGDAKALDLWTYERSEPDPGLVLNFDIIDFPDVTTTISMSPSATPGNQTAASIQFANVGSQSANNIGYNLELPPGLSGVSCAGATCNYNSATGQVSIAGLPGSLSAGQSSSITLFWTAPEGPVELTSLIETSSDQGPNLAPDTAAANSVNQPDATEVDVVAQLSAPALAAPGSTVNVSLSYLNLGPLDAEDLAYTAQLPAGLSGVACGGATCSYNSVTGVVSITGLPTSLASGGSTGLTLSYIAPSSGSVSVSTSVTTSTDEANLLNNQASATTNISSASTADVTTSVAPPPTANAGSTVNVPVTFRNLGPQPANDVNYGLQLSTGLDAVSCSGATCSYDPVTGELTVTGLPGTLAGGQSVGFNVSYQAPASGPVTISSNITTTSTESNLGNNTAISQTQILGPDLYTTVTSSGVVPAGSSGEFQITFGNQGEAPADDVVYEAELPPGLTGVTCSGATCTYDSTTGTLTFTGLPTTLIPGQQVSVVVNVPTSTPGEYSLTASLTTTTPELELSNNQATNSFSSSTLSAIPSLSSLGLIILSLLMGGVAFIRRRKMLS